MLHAFTWHKWSFRPQVKKTQKFLRNRTVVVAGWLDDPDKVVGYSQCETTSLFHLFSSQEETHNQGWCYMSQMLHVVDIIGYYYYCCIVVLLLLLYRIHCFDSYAWMKADTPKASRFIRIHEIHEHLSTYIVALPSMPCDNQLRHRKWIKRSGTEV